MLLNLVQNEVIKWIKRTSFYVMSGILVLLSVVSIIFIFMMDNGTPQERNGWATSDWRQALEKENESLRETLSADVQFGHVNYMEKQLALNEYRLANDLEPNNENSVWTYMDSNIGLTSVVTLFVIIIAGGIVASEFTWGTIKLLMIRPISRGKILLSKYMTVLIFGLIFYVLLFGTSYIVGAIGFGFANHPELLYINGTVYALSSFVSILFKILLSSFSVLMFATFAFMISTVFRNNSLAIGLSLFLLFTGTQITQLVGTKYEWAKFSPFANIHFDAYFHSFPIVEGTTLTFSIIMFLLYFGVFMFISFLTFKKRDIAA
ncbi:ABC transporter permease [Bacillus alkalisoli]|uniref:ABC transporter permease n=1 Tax=Bacillus alkalisoli TaxID=2011008 RepID=UPI001D0D3E25|nr:ABC transporter permease [Bacillus alkalisoli]